jgi:LuxR family maltose regulon positive regulatory protein
MCAPLVDTKFHIPDVRPDLVSRQRLLQRLHSGLHCKLTLVSAPAGFGKTTLLSEWVSTSGWGRRAETVAGQHNRQLSHASVVWLSLDEGDNDPARFLTYLIAALQRIDDSLGAGIQVALQSPKPPPFQSLMTTLINQIDASSHGGGPRQGPCVLILDDYHLITAQPVHAALTFLLDHMPPNLRLVIATRADPPLPLARLRGRGELNEIRQDDLRFVLDEVARFLRQGAGLDLADEDVTLLTSRTEGWIAGLQLAALAMQGMQPLKVPGLRGNPRGVSNFIKGFGGAHRFILDYLVEEVLAQQSPTIQEFLLKTSLLKRLNASLCDMVLQKRDREAGSTSGPRASLSAPQSPSQQILEELEAANLFVVPLDGGRRWYRYHHLFSDLLQQRLKQTQPHVVTELHCLASLWHEQNGFLTEAIDHALAAGEHERAADLIERVAEETWMRSEVATFLHWMDGLPKDLVRARPFLGVLEAMALLMSGQPLEVSESHLQYAQGTGLKGTVPAAVIVFRALRAAYQGRTRQSAELSRQALDLLPKQSLFLRSLVVGILGLAQMYGGDFVAATQALEETARIGQKGGNAMNTVLALCHLAEISLVQGRLQEAKRRYEQAIESARGGRGELLPIAGMALIGLGQMLMEWNELKDAEAHVRRGIDCVSQWGEVGALKGYTALARIKQARGDLASARRLLQTAEEIAINFDVTDMDDMVVGTNRARLWIAEGNLEAAARWAEEHALDADICAEGMEADEFRPRFAYCYLREGEYLMLARVLIAQAASGAGNGSGRLEAGQGRKGPDSGGLEQAVRLLDELLHRAEHASYVWRQIEILVLRAIAFELQADTGQAMQSVERALVLAEPEGYVRTFVEAGEPMARLLRLAASRGIAPQYVTRLLAAIEAPAEDRRREMVSSSQLRAPIKQPLADPLTEREMEVLGLLSTHLSVPEIADELFIAVSTVRAHTKSIYSKMSVHRRLDAVDQAKALQLL